MATEAIVQQLNHICELELSGVSRYLLYSFMCFGPNRIPVVSYVREQVQEGIQHAILVGEKVTALGGIPSVVFEPAAPPRKFDTRSLLEASLEHERRGLGEYKKLLALCGDDVALEELCRSQIRAETEHQEEIEKMLRQGT